MWHFISKADWIFIYFLKLTAIKPVIKQVYMTEYMAFVVNLTDLLLISITVMHFISRSTTWVKSEVELIYHPRDSRRMFFICQIMM